MKAEEQPLNLIEEFPPVAVSAWEAQIAKDLKGADYEKRLVWKTDEGIAVRPYYTEEDLQKAGPAVDAAPGQFPFLRGNGKPWTIAQPGSEPEAQIRADRFHGAGGTAVQEIGLAIAEGVELLSTSKTPVDEAAPKLVARFAIGSNFFFEIAKLRAARLLWAQAVSAFGAKNAESGYLHIHAITAAVNKTLYDPYNNVLRASAEALSAVLGGCDWLTVQAFRFDERLARNIQLILKEESHLDRVMDPAGGSYYIEVLTDALAREAWKVFQQVEADGGFATAAKAGKIEEMLSRSRQAKEAAVASRRRFIVGTNNFPNLKERLEDAVEVEGWRLAGLFERIRIRTERFVKSGGKQPKILLLERGDVKMRKARAGFCTNFFGCAGFAVKTAKDLQDADLVVLCSSDPEYVEFAKDVIGKVKVPVWVAGNPKEQIEELKAAGVTGFVHLGSNAVETLSGLQNKLGVAE